MSLSAERGVSPSVRAWLSNAILPSVRLRNSGIILRFYRMTLQQYNTVQGEW